MESLQREARNTNPFQADVALVADFLRHKHRDIQNACSTVAGYRTAITNTLHAVTGVEIGTSQ